VAAAAASTVIVGRVWMTTMLTAPCSGVGAAQRRHGGGGHRIGFAFDRIMAIIVVMGRVSVIVAFPEWV